MKYDLVFEGGGAKGMVFVGACDELLRRRHEFDRLLGTSAGAITATLLAAGYTSDELLTALAEKGPDGKSVFNGFMGMPPPFADAEILAGATRRLLDGVDFKLLWNKWEKKLDDKLVKILAANESYRHVIGLIERGGWFSADRFVDWLTRKLKTGTWNGRPRNFSDMTLEQFFNATQRELSMVASDTTDGKMLVLNHRTAPKCPLVRAVRMSMSIPLVWDEVTWQASWGPYRDRDLTNHVIVDGGVLSNFPIELFISDEPQVVGVMGRKRDTAVLGMLIDERLPVGRARGILVDVNVKPGELRTVQRLQRLVDTATCAHDKMVIDEYSGLVVRLPAMGYGTTEFDMDDGRRTALVNAGRAAMAAYFDAAEAAAPRGRPRSGAARTKAASGTVRSKAKSRAAGRVPSTADRIATSLIS
jgi:predicted acylesterase/phospholipase RssA